MVMAHEVGLGSERGAIGRLSSSSQDILIAADVADHVRRYRQMETRSTEAGGQLFGSIGTNRVNVLVATGPYPRDERSRYRYRSDPTSAQSAIELQAQNGMLYLGEWHTHAEDIPDSSGLDDSAMRLILTRSQLNSNALIMLIVGRANGVAGLGLWSVSLKHTNRWSLSAMDG
jgi:integrative and conjugative element protein (TIGR02256 family)